MAYRIITESYRDRYGRYAERSAYRDRTDAEALHSRLMAQREPSDDCTYAVETLPTGRHVVAVIDATDRDVIGYL